MHFMSGRDSVLARQQEKDDAMRSLHQQFSFFSVFPPLLLLHLKVRIVSLAFSMICYFGGAEKKLQSFFLTDILQP